MISVTSQVMVVNVEFKTHDIVPLRTNGKRVLHFGGTMPCFLPNAKLMPWFSDQGFFGVIHRNQN